jgi:very-short-patch-repair endonuclease
MNETLSEYYARRDGIKSERGPGRGRKDGVINYLIPCSECGTIIKRQIYNGDKVYLCPICKRNETRKKKAYEDKFINVETKWEKRFNSAIESISRQVRNFDDYEDAIRLARTRLNDYDSIPEAMVAIELVRLGHSVIPQQKIGRYKVDFALKDIKTIIEVDGEVYHKNIYKTDREAVIQLSLGMDWKIIHIPASLISKDIQKLEKIISKFGNVATPGK